MARVASSLVGLGAGIFAALWLGSSALGSASIVQTVAVLASAIVAMLATAMGGLMLSDWQAELQTRHEWTQLGLTPAELSTLTQVQTAWDVDPRYQSSATYEALLAIFRRRSFYFAARRPSSSASAPERRTKSGPMPVMWRSPGSVPPQRLLPTL